MYELLGEFSDFDYI